MRVAQSGRRLYIYNKNIVYKFFFKKERKMNFKKLLELLEKGENLMNPLSGIAGSVSGILNTLGIGRRRQIRQQKEMVENAAKINYKYGEMAAENAFERQQVLYNKTYRDWETPRIIVTGKHQGLS